MTSYQNHQANNAPIAEKDLLNIALKPMSENKSNLENGTAVLEAIIAIQAEILEQGGIAKSRHNDQQNFWYRSIFDMYKAISPLMVKHKVTCIGNIESCAVSQFLNKRNEPSFKAVVLVRYTLTSLKDSSKIEVCFTGEANDPGDKATTKAVSAAKKAFYEDTFAIPTGNDEQPAQQQQNKKPQQTWGKNNGYRSNNTGYDNRPRNPPANNQANQANKPASLSLKNEIDERLKKYGYRLNDVLKNIGLDVNTVTDQQVRNVYNEIKQSIQSNLTASNQNAAPPNSQRH